MNNFLKFIENKIKENIKIESISIIDNSSLHKKHKFFSADKYHLKLEIKSDYLNSLTKLKAQRAIMKLLTKELNTKIHALEIKIK
ncbi:BolA family transcriptional regulator [Pelagibacteraceae bacterium]|jgi:stress-induced morphogen|nr:BolA family transcriptional regulator [Pelagibacteraceae bacterium]|tara:strand:+ start:257 stop:511 length:255 start_codon:yes stop_codon:yes gene_type:complete